jgi:putative MATE family efflux protein
MDQTFMKKKPILPLVLSMSLPMALSMLVNSLYNIVDSYFIAGISDKAMTAISLVFPLQNVAGAVSIGFGVGVNAVTAFYLGAQQNEKADEAASLGLLLSLVHSVILTIILLVITPAFLRSFTSDPEVIDYGIRYSWIALGFCTVGQVHLIFEKLFQAIGRMNVSMMAMLAGCIANIILDPMMIYGWGPFPVMSIEGAAAATIIGQFISLLIYYVIYLKGGMGSIRLSLKKGWKSLSLSKQIYGIGIPAIMSQALPSVLISALNGILAGISEAGVLVLGIYYKLQTFIFLTTNGIVQGIRPIISYNYGAGEKKRVRKIFTTALFCALVIMAVGVLFCLAIPDRLFALFTKDPAVIEAGAHAMRIISIGFLFSAVSFAVSGTLEALGKGGSSFLISLLRNAVVILPAAWLLSGIIGLDGVWHAFWITEVSVSVISLIMYRRLASKVLL